MKTATLACYSMVAGAALLASGASPAVSAASPAEQLKQQAAGIRTAEGVIAITRQAGELVSRARYAFKVYSPQQIRLDLLAADAGAAPRSSYLFDGGNLYLLDHQRKTGLRRDSGDTVNTTLLSLAPALVALIRPELALDLTALKPEAERQVAGEKYQVYATRLRSPAVEVLLILDQSGRVKAVERQLPAPAGKPAPRMTYWIEDLKLNRPLAGEKFVFGLPAGYETFKPPARTDYTADLVPVGKPAPDFELPRPSGERLSLNGALQGKKAVLLNFWFHG